MKITSKNLIIMLILIFLIFNQFMGLAWEVVKTILYVILFMFLISQISPDLYNYLLQILNLKNLTFRKIPETITLIIKKLKSMIPFLNNNKEKNKK